MSAVLHYSFLSTFRTTYSIFEEANYSLHPAPFLSHLLSSVHACVVTYFMCITIPLGSEKIPSLTGGDRINWAKARGQYFAGGKNRLSLDLVERAAFVVVLDPAKPADMSEQAHCLIHGDGTNLWFDKSVSFVKCYL